MSAVNQRPRVLIEDWLPLAELGIESRREAAPIPGQFPKLKTLHVWWARRPLTASAAVVLGGVLPAWSDETRVLIDSILNALSDAARQNVLHPRTALRPLRRYSAPSEEWYRDWLMHLVGIWGDPVGRKAALDAAHAAGTRLLGDAYGYRVAFRNSPDADHLLVLHRLLEDTWGQLPVVLDSTAGGGSIPFASARFGLPTIANDLNSVAAAMLVAGVEVPAELGRSVLPDLLRWGRLLTDRVEQRLIGFFPTLPDESILNYIYAHTVACPRTGGIIPLIPDPLLRRTPGREVGVRVVIREGDDPGQRPTFELLRGSEAKGCRATVVKGTAVSPYDHLPVDGEYIRSEAQAGRMGYELYAVAIRNAQGKREFRGPLETDLAALRAAEAEVSLHRAEWEFADLIPTEMIPDLSNYERGHKLYGLTRWTDFYTPRQLLVHATFAEEFSRLVNEAQAELGPRAGDVLALLTLLQGKAINWNGRQASWDVSRQKTRSVFDKHNFAFKWMFSEFEGSSLYSWALEQLVDAYKELTDLFEETGLRVGGPRVRRDVLVTQGNAADLQQVSTGSVAHLCIDPPYYDNVMYAELSDYFYVWERRTLGRLRNEFFQGDLADKENEAVANLARFVAMGKRRKALADADYEAKMTAIFTEAGRVLRDDGVLTVMFTHKRAEAWDTLGTALLHAGFTVETSWPVNTESEHSLHQAKVNAAASTIMLVCRKRVTVTSHPQLFFADIEPEVRSVARAAVERFEHAGLTGVDLLLSTYGPVLSVISAAWPVYSSHARADGGARLLRPEEALEAARAEVVRLQRQRLVGHAANLDALSDFSLIAWDTFKAHEFLYDDARRLALAVGGLDMDELQRAKILDLKAGKARLMEPKERVRRDDGDTAGVRPSATAFGSLIDAVHTVMYVAEVDGLPAAKVLMDRVGLSRDDRFVACVQGLVNSIPRVRVKGEWTASEAGTLDRLVGAYLSDAVTLPPVVDPSAAEPERLF